MFNGIMLNRFPKSHVLHKLINKNNTKISYSTTPNMAQIIAGHNKKLIKNFVDKKDKINNPNKIIRTCNCRRGNICPLGGKCLTENVLYKATCSADREPDMEYIGLTAPEFKFRYNNYTTSFKNEHSGQSTTLKTYYWKMKKERKNPKVSFEILRVVPSFTPEVGRCALCTAEKLAILKADPKKTLNKRSEIMSICRHKRKFILEYAKINP